MEFERNDRVKLSTDAMLRLVNRWSRKGLHDRATVHGYSRRGTVKVVWDGSKSICTYAPRFLEKVWE